MKMTTAVRRLMSTLFAIPKPKPRRKVKSKAVKSAKVKPALAGGLGAGYGLLTASPAGSRTRTRVAAAKRTSSQRATAATTVKKTESSAPHIPPAPGKWLASHLSLPSGVGSASARRMSYWLYLPSHPPESAARDGMPLLVMLHGCHQTATQFAQGTRMNQLAERMGYAVLYPQQLVSTQAQRCWKWYDRGTQEGGGDVRMIVGIIDKVRAQYPIDGKRIYIGGISAGAGMANIVALNHPELIAAVGLHSGPVFGAGHSTIGALGVMQHGAGARADHAIRELLMRRPQFPAMPAILIQGQDDSVVRPINQIQLTQQSLALNGLPALARPKVTTRPGGRGGRHNAHQIHDFYVGRKLMLRVARIAQLEHAWSGGDPDVAFNAKAGPDASKMMMDFFARHQRRT
jgi:poly(hydroxyalkanoate) depolymerase family esterase